MIKHIKNITLVTWVLLYLFVSSITLIITISPKSFYKEHIISSSNNKAFPVSTKAWIQRKHIPLTIKVTGSVAVPVAKYYFPSPTLLYTGELSTPISYYSLTFILSIQNKAPPISC